MSVGTLHTQSQNKKLFVRFLRSKSLIAELSILKVPTKNITFLSDFFAAPSQRIMCEKAEYGKA